MLCVGNPQVSAKHKVTRLSYCDWLLARHQSTLDRQAYTAGTTIFLARGADDHNDKKRAALGRFVWRFSSGKDGLFEDNIGPSLYAKAQGYPVKIWGFLANGRLVYWTLLADYDEKSRLKTCNMNTERYHGLINSRFKEWRRACFGDDLPCTLIQDYERCLRAGDNLEALRKAGCPALANYPPCSPDLNPMDFSI